MNCAWAEGTGTLGRIERSGFQTATALIPTPRPELDERCPDCDGHPNCICEIALATEWRMTHAEMLHEATEGRR